MVIKSLTERLYDNTETLNPHDLSLEQSHPFQKQKDENIVSRIYLIGDGVINTNLSYKYVLLVTL